MDAPIIDDSQYTAVVIEMLQEVYEPAERHNADVELLNTDQVKAKVCEFLGVQIPNYFIYQALAQSSFRMVDVGGHFYWQLRKK